jgi:hypothetical protein
MSIRRERRCDHAGSCCFHASLRDALLFGLDRGPKPTATVTSSLRENYTVEVRKYCINGQEIAPGYTGQNDPIALGSPSVTRAEAKWTGDAPLPQF